MQDSIVWATLLDVQKAPSDPLTRRASGRALASQLLRAFGDTERTIDTDARGKPIVRGEPERHISISHTGSMIAAAASTIGPIGIDVERHNPARNLGRLANAAYGPLECEAVATHGISAFYRIWTLREAIGKATGDGMSLVMDRIDRLPVVMSDGVLVVADEEWLVAHDTIALGISLALAVRVASPEARMAAEACSLACLQLDFSAPFLPECRQDFRGIE